ncbi:MAG: [LysW]-lysine hydrolase [Anaerolineae bacterium]|nr:[LysW]-lysine hydrolase [Anaerolineae bacterium]
MDEVTFLEQLVSIPSPSGEEKTVGKFLVEQMAGMGLQAHLDEVGNAVGVMGDSDAECKIVLLGHMDTVTGNVPVRLHGNLLYGRGTADAKGPLAAFILATARVAPRLRDMCITVIGAVEEEAFSKGARHLARTMDAPDFAVIGEPSDWDAITLGYKGRLWLDYTWEQPDSHSAGEQTGPAEKAVTFWNQLMDYAERRNRGREGHFDTLDPALREFRTFSDGLNTGVKMSVAMRLPPDFKPEVLKRKMRAWAEGAKLKYSPLDMPYHQSDKNNPLVRAMLKAIRAEGGRPRFKLKTGTSDMNTVGPAWRCPIVAYGPGDSSLDHTPKEHIDIQEYKRAIDVLTRTLEILGS